jgi:hypothetical protein
MRALTVLTFELASELRFGGSRDKEDSDTRRLGEELTIVIHTTLRCGLASLSTKAMCIGRYTGYFRIGINSQTLVRPALLSERRSF